MARTRTKTGLDMEVWGDGTPAVLVHGSLATAAEEWEAQRPLIGTGFRLLMPDRRGFGRSPQAGGDAVAHPSRAGDVRPRSRPALRAGAGEVAAADLRPGRRLGQRVGR